MNDPLSPQQLDTILGLQLTIAWAGEGAGEPRRLGWWNSDLVDREGGGDLLTRLVPKTAAWAGLVLVRAAARRVEAGLLKASKAADQMWTLFHLGAEVDQQLDDRLVFHRGSGVAPAEVFGERWLVGKPFTQAQLEAELSKLGKPKVEMEPNGRRVATRVSSPLEASALLAAALLPLAPKYPLPFVLEKKG